jgi:hypothetical protein
MFLISSIQLPENFCPFFVDETKRIARRHDVNWDARAETA